MRQRLGFLVLGIFIVLFSCKKENNIIGKYAFLIGDTTHVYTKYDPPFRVIQGYSNGIPISEMDTLKIETKEIRIGFTGEHDWSSYSKIISLSDSLEFSIEYATISNSPDKWQLIRKFKLNDKIYYGLDWNKEGYFNGSSRSGYSFWYWGNSTNYFAIRIKSNNRYRYGWVEASISYTEQIIIHSYGIMD